MKTTHPTSEKLAETVAAIARGDTRAVADLYDATHSLVYRLAHRILRNAADAEEATFDVYTQVWRTAVSYQPARGTVSGWLVVLTRSRALDRLRARTVQVSDQDIAIDVDGLPSSRSSPEETTSASQRAQRARGALAALPAPQRTLIERAFIDGRTHREIASELSLPLGTVKTRIRLGLLALKAALRDLDPAARARCIRAHPASVGAHMQ